MRVDGRLVMAPIKGRGRTPLLPRGIIGRAGKPQYFIPLSHLTLQSWETEWRDWKGQLNLFCPFFAKLSPIIHSIVNRVQPSHHNTTIQPAFDEIFFFQGATISDLRNLVSALLCTATAHSLVSFQYWFCEMKDSVPIILLRATKTDKTEKEKGEGRFISITILRIKTCAAKDSSSLTSHVEKEKCEGYFYWLNSSHSLLSWTILEIPALCQFKLA